MRIHFDDKFMDEAQRKRLFESDGKPIIYYNKSENTISISILIFFSFLVFSFTLNYLFSKLGVRLTHYHKIPSLHKCKLLKRVCAFSRVGILLNTFFTQSVNRRETAKDKD